MRSILTHGASDWESFKIDGNQYLAVANQFSGDTSYIYQWLNDDFVLLQSVPTSGAVDWEYFTINGNHYVMMANQTGTHSVIYQWNGTQFDTSTPFQSIPTSASADWESFTMNGEQYLVVANSTAATSSLYRFDTNVNQFVLATEVTLDLGTDEDSPLTVTAAQLLANDGGATSITAVSATAVDSSGNPYGAITHSGGAGYDNITFTPNAAADALVMGDIKDVYFTYTNNFGVINSAMIRIGGLNNDPTDSNLIDGTPVITGAGHSYDLDTTTAQTLTLTSDMIIGGGVTQNEPANAGDADIQGLGGYNEYIDDANWIDLGGVLGVSGPDRNQVVVDGNASDALNLVNGNGLWTDAQKPPNQASDDKPSEKPLAASCEAGVQITSSSGAVFERFIGAEEDTCELDFTADESADADGRNDSKKRKCKPNE